MHSLANEFCSCSLLTVPREKKGERARLHSWPENPPQNQFNSEVRSETQSTLHTRIWLLRYAYPGFAKQSNSPCTPQPLLDLGQHVLLASFNQAPYPLRWGLIMITI